MVYVYASTKLGPKTIIVKEEKIHIPLKGVWVTDEQAEILTSMAFPIWCPSRQKFEPRQGIFINPNKLYKEGEL